MIKKLVITLLACVAIVVVTWLLTDHGSDTSNDLSRVSTKHMNSVDSEVDTTSEKRINNKDNELVNPPKIGELTKEPSYQKIKRDLEVFEEKNFISNGSLKSFSASESDFMAMLDRMEELTYGSGESLALKGKFQNKFYSTSGFTNANILIERMECGRKVCLTSIAIDDDESFMRFYTRIQEAKEEPILATTINYSDDGNRVFMTFPTDPGVKSIQVSVQ